MFGRHICIMLKSEQRQVIENLLLGQDMIAILPTGFGKSIIIICRLCFGEVRAFIL